VFIFKSSNLRTKLRISAHCRAKAYGGKWRLQQVRKASLSIDAFHHVKFEESEEKEAPAEPWTDACASTTHHSHIASRDMKSWLNDCVSR
jgi:hypothetical protein